MMRKPSPVWPPQRVFAAPGVIGRELAEEAAGLDQLVDVRVGHERIAEALRVHRRAVVALDSVLDEDLPVRLHGIDPVLAEFPVGEAEVALARERLECRMHVEQARRGDVGIDDDEAAPDVDGDGDEREVGALEVHLAGHARRVLELAVERVRPAVVAALQKLAATVLHRHRMRAVPADVDEAVELALGVARDHDGHAARAADHVVAHRGELGLGAEQRPAVREDPLILELGHVRIGVPAGRQRPATIECLCDLVQAKSVFRGDRHLEIPNPAPGADSFAVVPSIYYASAYFKAKICYAMRSKRASKTCV